MFSNISSKVKGRTPLTVASRHGSDVVTGILLRNRKLRINARHKRSSALIYVACNGHTNIVANLLRHDDINVNLPDTAERTALWHATYRGPVEVERQLLHFGANGLTADENGLTPFKEAVFQAKKPTAGQLAYLEHAQRDWIGRAGFGNLSPPLCWAAQYGAIDFVHYLLVEHADVNETNIGGFVSAQWKQEETALLLLEQQGVNVQLQDNDGRTALHYAAMNDLYDVAKKVLVDGRLELNSQDKYGNTSLWWASRMGSYRVRNLLLAQSGIHPNPLGMDPDSGRVTTAFQNVAESKNSLAVHLIQTEDDFGQGSRITCIFLSRTIVNA
ncbi:uncharacterized protein N7498_001727 [Penicillium cinerascens]|uniref:Uncharacterized protein n=1 Tax=Penicillium cinerascens TaxID=70096 RepID=A0A9W9N8N5_9EURO|nr:uncharacterized protein N7498_001727 [Penicillium cinerascens]KAJ5215320.1 hypothetical protein N7498_001727 [Penicillium cinerascens]